MLRSDLRDHSDVYIVVKARISVTGTNNANRKNKKLTVKSNAPFRSCISKINSTFIDNTDVHIVRLMYNLLEQWQLFYDTWKFVELSCRCREWWYNGNHDAGNKTTTSKSFEYKTKIVGSTPTNTSRLDAEVAVPSKYLSNFWRFLDLPYEAEDLDLLMQTYNLLEYSLNYTGPTLIQK